LLKLKTTDWIILPYVPLSYHDGLGVEVRLSMPFQKIEDSHSIEAKQATYISRAMNDLLEPSE
jgi:hypothetical protein